MPNHNPEAIGADLATMKYVVVKPAAKLKDGTEAPLCQPEDFASIHWTANLAKDGKGKPGAGKLVEDSRKFLGKDKPKRFRVGHFDKIKCFDIILPQMRKGEVANVFCPSYLAYGHTETYSFANRGNEIIPSDSNLWYQIEVIDIVPSKNKGKEIKVSPPVETST